MLCLSSRPLFLLSAVILLTGIVGCGGEKPVELIPASGQLTIDGQPAGDILIQVTPDVAVDVKAITSTGTTDSEGNFTLKASDGRDGAMPGSSKVILTDLLEERPAQGQEVTSEPRIPSDYQILGPSSLTVEVSEGNPIVISIGDPGQGNQQDNRDRR